MGIRTAGISVISTLTAAALSSLSSSPVLVQAASGSDSNSCSNTLKVDYPAPVAADGWSYRLVATDFKKPRGIVVDDKGALLLIDSGAGIVHLKLNDEGGTCVSLDKKTTLDDDEDLNHGIALSEDGKTLYASTSDEVYSWDYDSSGPSLSDSKRTLVTNMSNSDHTTRTLLLSRHQPGVLVVSRGSDSNQDDDARDLKSGHAQIRSFNISDGKSGGGGGGKDGTYDFLDGRLLGWGLRNSVGVAEHPSTGGIWSVENSVDELERMGKDIHQDNPAEELNYHGFLNSSTENQGGNYGYPRCFAVWSTKNFPDRGKLVTGDQFPGEETKSLTDESCNDDFVAPRLAFQAHMAPLDIKFTDKGDKAYVTFHGSWDRDDPVGYKIAEIDFSDGGEPTAPRDSMNATTEILHTPDLSKCPDDCFRPVGLAWAKDKKRIFFTSDATGELFVLEHGRSGDTGGDGASGGGDDDAGAQLLPSRSAGVAVAFAAVVVGFFLA